MLFSDTLSIARRGIGANFLRSLLTMLGIIIGVGSVVLMTSIGASVEQLILSQVSTLGARSMIVIPGREHGPPTSDSITLDDAEELKRLSTIETVAPVIMLAETVRYGREERSPETLGITSDFFKTRASPLRMGACLIVSMRTGRVSSRSSARIPRRIFSATRIRWAGESRCSITVSLSWEYWSRLELNFSSP